MSESRLSFRHWVIIIALTALALRCREIFAPLTYDEIWTLEKFSPLPVLRILNDIALPNNHPLNTLWIKLITAAGWPLTTLRLHSLAAGIGAAALAGVTAYVLFSSRAAALFSALAMALAAPAVFYSQLARGYSLQLFFLLLFAAGTALAGEKRPKNKSFCYLPEMMQLTGGICAVLTISSSVMFLGTAVLAAWYIRGRKLPERSTMISIGGAGLFALIYLIVNHQALKSGQQWGETIDSAGKLGAFLLKSGNALFPLALLPLIAVCGWRYRRIFCALAGMTLLVLVSALITRGGPPRVYLPLCAAAAIAAGGGAAAALELIKKPQLRFCAGILAVLLLAAGWTEKAPLWKETDFDLLFRDMANQPAGTLVICRGTTGYPLMWNNRPAIWQDYGRRLGENLDTLIMVSENPALNGIYGDGAEQEMTLPFAGKPVTLGGEKAWQYRLIPKSGAPVKGEILLFTLTPGPSSRCRDLQYLLYQYGGFMILNAWFNVSPLGEGWCAAGVITDTEKPLPVHGWPAQGLRCYTVNAI